MIRTYDLYTFLKKNARMLLSFVLHFLIIISLFLLCDASSRDRKVCVREDIQDLARSCSGRKVCLKKRIAKKTINQLRDQLEQLKIDIKSLGRQHEKDLKKILSALLRLEGKDGSYEKTKTTTEAPKPRIKRSCADAMGTSRTNKIYEILIPKFSDQPFKVACEVDLRRGKAWTIILRRMNGHVDFYRKWNQYKMGFGQLDGEYFLGLDKIHAITNDQPQELFILLEDREGRVRYQSYDAFAIGDELELYKLHTLGNSGGTAGDSFRFTHGMYFTTSDRDNDRYPSGNCAIYRESAGWFNNCLDSNLMGNYGSTEANKGVTWDTFRGSSVSMKRAIMMLRPKSGNQLG